MGAAQEGYEASFCYLESCQKRGEWLEWCFFLFLFVFMTTLSQQLFARAQKRIPGGVNSPVRAFKNVGGEPFFVRSGKGAYLTDVDGKGYVDYIGTWGPAILGHAPEVVLQALSCAMQEGVSFGTPTEREVVMAETICSWVPAVEKVRMVSSGTEATMSCVRLARGFTQRDKIIKFVGCYHGHVDSLLVAAGSGALTFGRPDSAGVPGDLAALTLTLPYNDVEALEACFAHFGEEIAGVIVESFPANAGLYFPKPEFLAALQALTKKWGALLIWDEVMTGFRVAKGGAAELLGISPDLTAMGKVIGGGLPVGAFGGRADIMDELSPLGPVYQAGTLSGNPLALAAGLAQLEALEREDGFARLESLGAYFESGVRSLLREQGKNFTFHRVGSMFCLFFREGEVYDLASAQLSDKELYKKYFWKMIDQGIYMSPSAYETGFISLAHSEKDIERTLEAMDVALKAL